MKFSPSALLLLVSIGYFKSEALLVVDDVSSSQNDRNNDNSVAANLRNSGGRGNKDVKGTILLLDPSSCNGLSDRNSCFQAVDDVTGEACSWCVAGAVPSECVSQEQAAQLPAAVFECSTPSFTTGAHSSSRFSTFEFLPEKLFTLKLKENNIHRHGLEQQRQDDQDNSSLCDPSSKSISGYMDISGSEYDREGEDKHLFFWMFEKRGDVDESTPFIVWLTGGPGCSSTLALLTENGPCSVNDDGESTSVNPYSWTETAHVLWLDQPAGVGYSYGAETDSNEAMVAEDAYYFFQAFFQTYPEYQSSPLYIVGESYAGHYVPAMSYRIYEGNQKLKNNKKDQPLIKLNLAGLSIGNGLTNPEEQYKWYPEMGYNNSHGIQVFDETTYNTMKAVVPQCTRLISICNQGDSVIDQFACQSAFLVCNAGLTSPYQATGLNPYDIRIPCEVPPLCYDMSAEAKWLNLQSTKDALGVDPKHSHRWESCNFGINMKFHSDWMRK